MERNTLEKFFTGKTFIIPTYQRDYAWTQQNVDDLLNDIMEAIETGTSHYIGTFILSRISVDGSYHVVDGQQRLTTLTMILNSVINHLPPEQSLITSNAFIRDIAKNRWKLQPAEYNREYFTAIMTGAIRDPVRKSQRLLSAAYSYIKNYMEAMHQSSPDLFERYLDNLKQLEVMEFIEDDEGKAIRIFQTVNDRGRPLAIIEKTKSLLVYYSNRFLQGKHDVEINESFGSIYHDFSCLKEIGEQTETRVDLIAHPGFTEDSVLRYHFLSYRNAYYTYKLSTDYILDGFLKRSLRERQSEPTLLSQFIGGYVADLKGFFHDFRSLVDRIRTLPKYFKLFCVLGVSTNLYPLLIRLQGRGILEERYGDDDQLTFADLVEITDIRIFKTRGTDPVKDVSYLARDVPALSPSTIAVRLREIVSAFMADFLFLAYLYSDMYNNGAIRHILFELGESWRRTRGQMPFTVDELIGLMASEPTVEHIFSQTPAFDFPSRGFESPEEYNKLNHQLGNLSVLEKGLNSRCQHRTAEQKLEDPSLYKESRFDATKALVSQVAANNGVFDANAVKERTRENAEFAKMRWPLWR
jgi:hypothetical protein